MLQRLPPRTYIHGTGLMLKPGDRLETAAERSRQERQIANDRQLAEANRADARSGGSRRPPRGRRLFMDENKASLPSKLGE